MAARLREHGLSIFFLGLFVAALAGQAVAGYFEYNDEQAALDQPPVAFSRFLTSSAFVVDVAENWQSEYLQFFLLIAATVWLTQRGSPESKQPGGEGIESDAAQLVGAHALAESPRWARAGGVRRMLYSNSLLLVMGAIFVASWLIQSLAGVVVLDQERAAQGQAPIGWAEYLVSADFWNRTLQNWQSEFLAVASMVAFSIYLRQRGSPESKPVGMPHHLVEAPPESAR